MSTLEPIAIQTPDPENETYVILKTIEGHLKSIRSMLTFFTVMAILAIVVQACNVLTAF